MTKLHNSWDQTQMNLLPITEKPANSCLLQPYSSLDVYQHGSKMLCIHTVKFYSEVKENGIIKFADKQIKPGKIY